MSGLRPESRAERAVALSLIAGGVALRLWQWGAGASFWLDEIALARNILGRSLSPLLLSPLDYDQHAPTGWLALVHLIASGLGPSERALRLVPLVSSVAVLVLGWRVAVRLLSAPAALLALGTMAIAKPLVAYGAELKPYVSDAALGLLVTLFALRTIEGPERQGRARALAVAGLVLPFFSVPVVVVFGGVFGALAIEARLSRGSWRPLLAMAVSWAVGAGAAAVLMKMRIAAGGHSYLREYWAGGFPPGGGPLVTGAWVWQRLASLFGEPLLDWPVSKGMAGASLAGLGLVALTGRAAGLMAVAPLAAGVGAAIVGAYPLEGRLALYLIPGLLLGLAALVDGLVRLAPRARLALPAALLVAAPPLLALRSDPPVWRREEMKVVLAMVQKRLRPGDVVYVHYGARQALEHYGPAYGLPPDRLLFGRCHAGDLRAALAELDVLRGRPRVWVLITHALPPLREKQVILAYLDAIGKRLGTIEHRPRRGTETGWSFAALWDLEEPSRLVAAEAASFTVPEITRPLGAWSSCEHGPVAPAASRGPETSAPVSP